MDVSLIERLRSANLADKWNRPGDGPTAFLGVQEAMSNSDLNNQESSAEAQMTLTEMALPSRSKDTLSEAEWNSLCEQRREIDDNACANCGASDKQLHVHHIVPDSNGGTVRMGNLRTLCWDCHGKAHVDGKSIGYGSVNPVNAPYIPMVETMRDLISEMGHPLTRVVALLLAKTGIRIDELIELDMDQLFLKRNPVSYRGIGPRRPPQPDHIRLPKRNAEGLPGYYPRLTDVQIPLDRELAQALQKWLTIRPDSTPSVNGDPVFLRTSNKWGTRLSLSMIHSTITSAASNIGLYHEGAGQKENVAPNTLTKFFDERFAGQPATKDYLIGRRDNMPFSFGQVVTDYREGVPKLVQT